SFDGMATVTGAQFVKSGADDNIVLLGAGGTKPISEFAGTPTDLSNNYTKHKQVDSKLSNYVNTTNNQSINGTNTFNAKVNATGFVKTGKDNSSVLLAGGGDRLLSSLEGLELVEINYTNNLVNPTSIMSVKCDRYGSLVNSYAYIFMNCGAGASGASVAVCILENTGFSKYFFYANDIAFAGSSKHVANFRFRTDGNVTITIKTLTATAGLADAASAQINVTYPAAN
ncbi:MAG: hypothetical protein EZS28_047894, partial [Streblomastix strix]